MINVITQQIAKFEKNLKLNYDLVNDNSFGLSGKCAVFVKPRNLKNLIKIIKICTNAKIKFFILGCGTNVLVLKNGFSGIVICTKNINKTWRKNNSIIAQCGTNMFKLNDFAVKQMLGGLEFSYGIPGSVGGGVAMNAGAFGFEFKDVISKVWAFNGKKIVKFKNSECLFEYRKSIFQNNLTVLKAEFKLTKMPQKKILEKNLEYIKIKRENQPYEDKSAGSFFKREPKFIVSKLIDELGFKNKKVGGAMVSPKHAGFIVNKNFATSDDVLELAEIISKKVAKTYGFDLQLEVKILGDKNENTG